MVKSTKSVKRQKLLETAKALFWKYGIKKVSIEEICKEAGVSKVTFYKYFSNKADIARCILQLLIDDGQEKFEDILQQEISFAKKVKKMMLLKLENTNEISIDFVKDIYNSEDSELREFMEAEHEKSKQRMLAAFTQAANDGEIRKDIKPAFLLHCLDVLSQMTTNDKLLKNYPNEQDLIMEVVNFFFYGLGIAAEE